MNDSLIDTSTITGRISAVALDLLDKNPEGLRWVELLSKIKQQDSSFHPKTVNGVVWKLAEKYPDLVYKSPEGLFCLIKYKSVQVNAVEEYIANVPAVARPLFDQLRDITKKQLPKAKEVLSYGVVGYKIDDKRARVFISGWKDHVAIYPVPKSESLQIKLKPYIKGKGTLWFSLNEPLPEHIIQEVIRELTS